MASLGVVPRNVAGGIGLAAALLVLALVAPDPSEKYAHVYCGGVIASEKSFTDNYTCAAETRRVPEWKECVCIRAPNRWAAYYWRFVVPLSLILIASYMLTGSVIWQAGVVAVSVLTGGIFYLVFASVARDLDSEGILFGVIGFGVMSLVVVCGLLLVRAIVYPLRRYLLRRQSA